MQKPMGHDLDGSEAHPACCRDRRARRGRQLPAPLQPSDAGAARPLDARRARHARRHRRPHRDRAALAPLDVPRTVRRGSRCPITRSTISTRSAGSPASRPASTARPSAHPDAAPAARQRAARSSSTTAIALRCSLVLNHTHRAGPRHRASQLMVEGRSGAVRLTWGVNLDYPTGPPDTMEVATDEAWRSVPLRGSWFIEAFEGPMSNLQRFVAGEDTTLVGSVDDAIKTMALVEACYESSERGGTPIPRCMAADTQACRRQGRSRSENRRAPALLAVRPPPSTTGSTTRWRRCGATSCPPTRSARCRRRGVDACDRGAGRGRRSRRRAGCSSSPTVIRSSPAWSAGSICSRRTSTRSSSASGAASAARRRPPHRAGRAGRIS